MKTARIGPRRLVLIGSAMCGYAELPLDKVLHIIARNNSGKTGIINALQYLYVEHGRGFKFPKDRQSRQSHRFYFPDDTSYVLVECDTPSGKVVHGIRGMGPATDYQRRRFLVDGPYAIDDYIDEVNTPRKWKEIAERLGPRLLKEGFDGAEAVAMLTGSDGMGRAVLPVSPNVPYDQFRTAMIAFLNLKSISGAELRKLVIATTRTEGLVEEFDIKTRYHDNYAAVQREKARSEELQANLPLVQETRDAVRARLAALAKASTDHHSIATSIERHLAQYLAANQEREAGTESGEIERRELTLHRKELERQHRDIDFEVRRLEAEVLDIAQRRQAAGTSAESTLEAASQRVDDAFELYLETRDRAARIRGVTEDRARARVAQAETALRNAVSEEHRTIHLARTEEARKDLQWVIEGGVGGRLDEAVSARNAAMRHWVEIERLDQEERAHGRRKTELAQATTRRARIAQAMVENDARIDEIVKAVRTSESEHASARAIIVKLEEDRASLPVLPHGAPEPGPHEQIAVSRTRPRNTELQALLAEAEGMRARIRENCQKLEAIGILPEDDAELLEALIGVEDDARRRIDATDQAWMTLQGVMHTDVKQFASSLEAIQTRVAEINEALESIQISNLQGVRLVIDERTDRMRDVNDIIAAGAAGSRGGAVKPARIREIIEKGNLELADLFTISIEITKDDVSNVYANLEDMESNGTAIMIKLSIGFSLLGAMMRVDMPSRFPFYIDEIQTLDVPNINGIIEYCTQRGAMPLLSSPHAISIERFETVCYPQIQGRRIVIDPAYHLSIANAGQAA